MVKFPLDGSYVETVFPVSCPLERAISKNKLQYGTQ